MNQHKLEIIVRNATQIDLDDISQIALTLYPSNFNGKGDDHLLEEASTWVLDHFESENSSQYLVAIVDGKIVGYTLSHSNAHGAGVISIIEWGAIKVEGLRGIGTKLIEETIKFFENEHAPRYGKPLTSVLIYTSNPGIGICEKLGFRSQAKLENLYGNGIDEYIFRKDF